MLNRHFVPNGGENFLFPPTDLNLRHRKNFGGLSLCFAPIVPQLNYFSVGFAEGFYRLFKRQSFRDFVLNIICRDIKLWVALAVIFGSQGERNSCAVECVNDFFLACIKPFGNKSKATNQVLKGNLVAIPIKSIFFNISGFLMWKTIFNLNLNYYAR